MNGTPLVTSLLRPPEANFLFPSTLDDALAMLAEDPDARPFAGGTNLVPRLMSRHFQIKTLVDLSNINDYKYVKRERDSIKIGALTTISELVESPFLQDFDAISTFGRGFVSPPIMNLATVGGSVALGDYTEDLVVIFESLGAKLKIRKKNVYETASLDGYVPPFGASGLIVEIDFPFPRDKKLFCFFDKLNMSVSRIPYASLALKAEFDEDVFSNVRLVANCAKGTIPGRLFEAENALTNTRFEKDVVALAVTKLEKEVEPHSDFMAPAWYRKEILGVLLRKLSSSCALQKGISKA
jgi:aerobic carbon-monoxide dehydrogenase medium subunit